MLKLSVKVRAVKKLVKLHVNHQLLMISLTGIIPDVKPGHQENAVVILTGVVMDNVEEEQPSQPLFLPLNSLDLLLSISSSVSGLSTLGMEKDSLFK